MCSCICTSLYIRLLPKIDGKIYCVWNMEKHLHGDSNGTHKALIFPLFRYVCAVGCFHIRQQSVSSQKAFGIRYLCSCLRALMLVVMLLLRLPLLPLLLALSLVLQFGAVVVASVAADMNSQFICMTRMMVIMFAQIQTKIDTKHEKW